MLAPVPSINESLKQSVHTEVVGEAAGPEAITPRTGASIDALLDRAVSAINRGDHATAAALADRVIAADNRSGDADDLLVAPTDSGEVRRLTILSADLYDPTSLALQVEPETYRLLVGRFREQVRHIADRFEGHAYPTRGDGLLVVFGYPSAHEDDVYRAVHAGLEITREVARLSDQADRRFGARIDVRVGVHRGLVYLDGTQDDFYGLAATLATQVSALAPVNAVAVSHSVEQLIRSAFDMEGLPAVPVAGTNEILNPFKVLGERAAKPAAPLGPLVGRDRELARLEKSWARARAGTLTVPAVVFRGDPGIGKSRLAAAATEMVRHDGGTVIELAGSPVHTDAGLYPVRTLLERRCGITRQTEPERRLALLESELDAQNLNASEALPLLAPVIGLDATQGYEPVHVEGRKLQELIAEELKRYLLACFAGSPGLLLVEDVHWFDPSTLDLLDAILNDTAGRLLAVITGRDGNWLSSRWPAKVFDLHPLTDEQTDELVRALNPAVAPADCAAVRARCDGVPYYIEQIVSGLEDESSDGDKSSVPDQLYEPLFARLLATANAVPVVEAAAIIGRHVERGLLVAVSSLTEDEVDDVIDELEDAKVLEPEGHDAWRFRHELLREVAAELAPPSVRRTLHAKVADALIEGAAGEPDWHLVAAHYEQAERYTDAATAYQQASADARRRGALEEARMYLTHALTQLGNCAPSRERDLLELRPRLERYFLASTAEGYQSPPVVEDVERCLELIGPDLHEFDLFGTLFAATTYYINKADLRRADQIVEALKNRAHGERNWWSSGINLAAGMIAFLRGQHAEASEHFKDATVGFVEDEDHKMQDMWFVPHDAVAMAHEHLAIQHVLQGRVAAAESSIRSAIERADELSFPGGPYNHVYAVDMEIWMRIEAGQFDRAGALVADMIEKAERYGFDFWQMFGFTEQTMVDAEILLHSASADADALTRQVESMAQFTDLWRSLGLFAYQTHYDSIIGRLLNKAGRYEEAQERINAALEIADETDMHFYDAELLRARACTYTDSDTRAADLGVAIELARHQDAPLFELRAALDLFELRGEEARTALTEALDSMPAECTLTEAVYARNLLG
nr:adenylate/guanylate cyclase domain-containing protein [Mycobacterium sp. GA-1285]